MDIGIFNAGSVIILTGTTEAGRNWLDDNLPADTMRWGQGWVVEPRYLHDIIIGAVDDGMITEHT